MPAFDCASALPKGRFFLPNLFSALAIIIMDENSENNSKITLSDMRYFYDQPRLFRIDCEMSYSDTSISCSLVVRSFLLLFIWLSSSLEFWAAVHASSSESSISSAPLTSFTDDYLLPWPCDWILNCDDSCCGLT